jgi:hypothetical protein
MGLKRFFRKYYIPFFFTNGCDAFTGIFFEDGCPLEIIFGSAIGGFLPAFAIVLNFKVCKL